MCAHCQVRGSDNPEYTIAGLNRAQATACKPCASHIAGTMKPRPQHMYDLPKKCADCGSPTSTRYGLDGRPLCIACQDPSYPSYLLAPAGIIVQDYLDVCHDIRRIVPVNARVIPAIIALAKTLPHDPREGNLFQPTQWGNIVGPVHTLAKLVALNVDLPRI